MALVPIRVDRTSKPPIGTPLRSDGHWSVQGLELALPFNEGAGISVFNGIGQNPVSVGAVTINQDGFTNSGSDNFSIDLMQKPYVGLVNGGTITTKIKLISAANQVFFGNGKLGDVFGYYFQIYNGYFLFYIGGLAFVWPNPYLYIGKNVEYTINVSSALIELYIDGVLLPPSQTAPAAFYNPSENYRIGCYYGGIFPMVATIGYQFIRSIVLTPQQRKSLSANPWQIYEPETVWVEVGGGGEAALFAGSIYGQSSASAQLSTAITIASQVVAAGSISGGIDTAIRMATNTQGSASASALLTTAIRMAASAQGYGSATADLSTVIALAADILAASSASGALSTAIRFSGALSGSSTTTAALTNAITMAAQSAGLGSISGQLAGTVAAALFAGTISGSSSASANLSTAVVLAAAAQGSSTAQAALSTALELAAQVNGIGSAAGTLGADISGLAGSLNGSSEAQATLATAIHLMGAAAGQCVVAGRLAEPVEILAQLRVMAADPLALRISVRDPLALRVTVQ